MSRSNTKLASNKSSTSNIQKDMIKSSDPHKITEDDEEEEISARARKKKISRKAQKNKKISFKRSTDSDYDNEVPGTASVSLSEADASVNSRAKV